MRAWKERVGDGLKEVYVAGSVGLWRFLQPGE
jgi:hypothetical protein